MNLTFEKENENLQITIVRVVFLGFGDDQFYVGWGGGGGLLSLPLCTQLAK